MTCPAAQARQQRRGAAERGSVTAELVLLTPLLILILLFVVALGRLASARLQVDTAAGDAARAASLARDPVTATQLAEQTATATLAGGHLSCAHLGVSVDTADFVPGGWVAVTVTCSVSLADMTGLRLPATETVSSRFVEPIDRYRGLS
ncbi:MAG: TadE/TadG family type IV pilus assembly protein [Mycobacteriales bacterium]